MSASTPVYRFAAGAIGAPGQRAFYLEVATEDTHEWYAVEKGQVAALAAESTQLLSDLGFAGAGADVTLDEIVEPNEIAFRVEEIMLVYVEETGLVTVTLRGSDDGESAVWPVTPAQLDAVAIQGLRSVAAGRPACPRCGLAMDVDGHICPTTNGDLRGHRA
jgi:uncharacterized repeat protein (TIGR03847 family)